VLWALCVLHAGGTVDREQVLARIRSFGDATSTRTAALVAPAEALMAAAQADQAAAGTATEAAAAAAGTADRDPLAADRGALLRVLEQHRWNMSNVAKALSISRNTLYRRMHRCRIPLSHQSPRGTTSIRASPPRPRLTAQQRARSGTSRASPGPSPAPATTSTRAWHWRASCRTSICS
jgi:DNA-binding phage protein